GDPACRWKSPELGDTHSGLVWVPCASCPVADCRAASDGYSVLPHVNIVPDELRYTRSSSMVVPEVELASTRMLPRVPKQRSPLSTETLFSMVPPLEAGVPEVPSRLIPDVVFA